MSEKRIFQKINLTFVRWNFSPLHFIDEKWAY